MLSDYTWRSVYTRYPADQYLLRLRGPAWARFLFRKRLWRYVPLPRRLKDKLLWIG